MDNSNQPKLTQFGATNNTTGGAGEPACTGIQFFMSGDNINEGKQG